MSQSHKCIVQGSEWILKNCTMGERRVFEAVEAKGRRTWPEVRLELGFECLQDHRFAANLTKFSKSNDDFTNNSSISWIWRWISAFSKRFFESHMLHWMLRTCLDRCWWHPSSGWTAAVYSILMEWIRESTDITVLRICNKRRQIENQ